MKIGVLGSGQLGRMLALSAYPLGHEMRFLALSEEDPSSLLGKTFIHNDDPNIIKSFAESSDVVTYESENTDVNIVNEISLNTGVYPSEKSLYISQHRGREKALFDKLNIPCAPYEMINNLDDLKSAVYKIGLPAILKTATDGYDGKGQHPVNTIDEFNSSIVPNNSTRTIDLGTRSPVNRLVSPPSPAPVCTLVMRTIVSQGLHIFGGS